MPVCACPHCKTQLWVNDAQLNIAQGFVVCSQCEGLFQARDHTRPTPPKLQAGQLPEARTDVKLVHRIGKEVRTRKVLSKNEIADLLDGMLPPGANAASAAANTQTFNCTLASLLAPILLSMQLFYLLLLR